MAKEVCSVCNVPLVWVGPANEWKCPNGCHASSEGPVSKTALTGEPKQGLAKLVEHYVRVALVPAVGAGDWMTDCTLEGFDAVTIEVARFTETSFIPLIRIQIIRHDASQCRTENGARCGGI